MANSFVNFLSEAANASGNLRDYQHASRLYVNNFYDLAPKAGWMYYVVVNINPAIAGAIVDPTAQAEFAVLMNRYKNSIGLLARDVEQPKFSIETETLNQYNKKTVIQKRINYNPLGTTGGYVESVKQEMYLAYRNPNNATPTIEHIVLLHELVHLVDGHYNFMKMCKDWNNPECMENRAYGYTHLYTQMLDLEKRGWLIINR